MDLIQTTTSLSTLMHHLRWGKRINPLSLNTSKSLRYVIFGLHSNNPLPLYAYYVPGTNLLQSLTCRSFVIFSLFLILKYTRYVN